MIKFLEGTLCCPFVADRLLQSLLLELLVAILVEMVSCGIVVYPIMHLCCFTSDSSRKRPLDEGASLIRHLSTYTHLLSFQAMMLL